MRKQFISISLLVTYILSSLVFVLVIFTPPVSAAGTNQLWELGSNCNKIERSTNDGPNGDGGPKGTYNTGKWKECQDYQRDLRDEIGCSGKMFDQKKDPNDPSRFLNEWYINAKNYSDCYTKAKNKIDKIAGNMCDSIFNDGNGTSQGFKDCETEQNRLRDAMGCSGRMFKPSGKKNYFTQDKAAIDECKARVEAAGSVSITNQDGSNSDPKKGANDAASGGGTDKDDNPECEVKLDSPLSWIVCPVVELGAEFTDFVFKTFVRGMLEDVPISTSSDNGSFAAWKQFRILGNVLLVGTLLAIVYTQARGGK